MYLVLLKGNLLLRGVRRCRRPCKVCSSMTREQNQQISREDNDPFSAVTSNASGT